MKCQILFSRKSKKKKINVSSAELAQREVKVKFLTRRCDFCVRYHKNTCRIANSTGPDQTAPDTVLTWSVLLACKYGRYISSFR